MRSIFLRRLENLLTANLKCASLPVHGLQQADKAMQKPNPAHDETTGNFVYLLIIVWLSLLVYGVIWRNGSSLSYERRTCNTEISGGG
jgi:hypothetical protein